MSESQERGEESLAEMSESPEVKREVNDQVEQDLDDDRVLLELAQQIKLEQANAETSTDLPIDTRMDHIFANVLNMSAPIKANSAKADPLPVPNSEHDSKDVNKEQPMPKTKKANAPITQEIELVPASTSQQQSKDKSHESDSNKALTAAVVPAVQGYSAFF